VQHAAWGDGRLSEEYVERTESGYYVAGTRVSLDSIVYAFLEGRPPRRSHRAFPVLTLEQVYGALTFYLAHRDDVDAYLRAQREDFESKRAAALAADPMFYQKLAASRRHPDRVVAVVRFQADADLNQVIVAALLRRNSAVDFRSAANPSLKGLSDLEVLALAAAEAARSRDARLQAMPRHFADSYGPARAVGSSSSPSICRCPAGRRGVVADRLGHVAGGLDEPNLLSAALKADSGGGRDLSAKAQLAPQVLEVDDERIRHPPPRLTPRVTGAVAGRGQRAGRLARKVRSRKRNEGPAACRGEGCRRLRHLVEVAMRTFWHGPLVLALCLSPALADAREGERDRGDPWRTARTSSDRPRSGGATPSASPIAGVERSACPVLRPRASLRDNRAARTAAGVRCRAGRGTAAAGRMATARCDGRDHGRYEPRGHTRYSYRSAPRRGLARVPATASPGIPRTTGTGTFHLHGYYYPRYYYDYGAYDTHASIRLLVEPREAGGLRGRLLRRRGGRLRRHLPAAST